MSQSSNPTPASPPAPADLPYGAPISLAKARDVLAAAQAEAQKNQWNVAIAVLDTGGHLIAFERLDRTGFARAEVAIAKARTAVGFRKPTKGFHEIVAAGGDGLRMLGLPGVVPVDGRVPLVADGQIIGAIGISGVTSAQDGQIARAGAASLN